MGELPNAVVKRLLSKHGDGLRVSGSALERAVAAAEDYIALDKGIDFEPVNARSHTKIMSVAGVERSAEKHSEERKILPANHTGSRSEDTVFPFDVFHQNSSSTNA